MKVNQIKNLNLFKPKFLQLKLLVDSGKVCHGPDLSVQLADHFSELIDNRYFLYLLV